MGLFDQSSFGFGSGIGGIFTGGGKSSGEARMLSPNLNDAFKGFQKLQPGLMSNQLQQNAIGEQQGLRGRLSTMLDEQGAGERARIDDAFQTAANNATGGLASRGFAGSSLNIPAQLGVERERNLAHAQLNDSLLGRRMGMESDVSKNISDLLFGSSEQATNLQSALLGSQHVGNFSESVSEDSPKGGGGGGSSSGGASYPDGTPREQFDAWSQQFQQPAFRDGSQSGGGGSGGGGGGGTGSGSSAPLSIANPFAAQPSEGGDNARSPYTGPPTSTHEGMVAYLKWRQEEREKADARKKELEEANASAGMDPQISEGDMSGGGQGMIGI